MLKFPLRRIWVSADTVDHGYNAYDFGWWDAVAGDPDSGRNPNLYAMSDGIVSKIVNSHPDDPDMEGYGNYIIISYPKEVRASIYAHLKKNSCVVKEKDKVSQMQKVAQVGNSGYSFGNHLHMEICKALSFSRHNGHDYIKNKDVYIDSWYIVDPDTQKNYPLPYMVIEPVEEDITKTQVLVSCDDLNVREAPSTSAKSAGFAQKGYYDVTETTEADGYVWAKVDKYWVASNAEGVSLIEASFAPVEADKTKEQVEVTIDDLRIRYEASTSSRILGYCPVGFYDIEETVSTDEYVWFKVCGRWIACVDGVVYHAAQDDKDEEIKKLKAKIELLESTIKDRDKEIMIYSDALDGIRLILDRFGS